MDLRVFDRAEATESEAVMVIDEFLKSGIDGVIVSGISTGDGIAALNQMVDGGIALGLLGSDAAGCRRSFVSMNDTTTAGRLAAEFLSLTVKGAGRNVSLFIESRDTQGQNEIVDAFLENADKLSLHVTDIFCTRNREGLAYEQMSQLLSRSDLPDGVYCTTANSVPLCRAIEDFGAARKFPFIASDVFPELDRYLDEQIVTATIYQDPIFQARRAFESMFLKLAEGKEPPEFIRAVPQLVLRSNRGLYL